MINRNRTRHGLLTTAAMGRTWIAAGSLFLLGFSQGWALQTETEGLHAVPAPGAVTIDGDLSDWDLSGQALMCYDVEKLLDVYSGRVAAMYDADNFYVSIHWKDPIPMGNSHDPQYAANRAWAGDCVQLRFRTDRILHATCWYYAPSNEPAIQLDFGKDRSTPFDGGSVLLRRIQGAKMDRGTEMAFRKDADGKGYVQEIKFPWSLLVGRKLIPGEKFQMGVELLWGEGDWPVHRYADNLLPGPKGREFFHTNFGVWGEVTLEPAGHLELPDPAWMHELNQAQPQGPIEIAYQLPKDALVTLAIDDSAGNRVRNLVAAQPRKSGKNIERWDGLDDRGRPAPSGSYRYRALYHDGIHLRYVMSFANPGNPPWETPDNRGAFYGDHTPPQAAAAAGEYVALAAPMGEAGKPIIGLDLEGNKLWGLNNRQFADGSEISLATDGRVLWVGNEGKRSLIYRIDMKTGRYSPWKKMEKDETSRDVPMLDRFVSDATGNGVANLSGIALADGILAVALAKENKLLLLDAETGDTRKEIPIPTPKAVTWAIDGSLIVLSEGLLLRLTDDGKSVAFTNGSYADGYGLAVDRKGDVYLSVRGPDQNVKVFSPDGKLVREIGKRGGRPINGFYDPAAMRNPGRLAVDSRDRLWVPESTSNPKRTSVWDLATGRLLRDIVGTTTYAGAGTINPDDPTMAFSDNTVYRIDLAGGSWQPVYSLGRSENPEAIFPARAGFRDQVFNRGDTTYVYSTDRTQSILCTTLHGGKWQPSAAIGPVLERNDPECRINFEHPLMKAHVGQTYAWADLNGDGLVQPGELTFAPIKARCPYWGSLPGRDGICTFLDGDHQQALWKFPVVRFADGGAPVYDPAHPETVTSSEVKAWGDRGGEGMIHGGEKGNVYLNVSPLTTMDAAGHILGTYPSDFVSVHGSHNATSAHAGYLIGPNSILGTADLGTEIGEVFSMNGNLGENYLFTADALWIQSLFKDTRGDFTTPDRADHGMSMDATSAGGESFGGDFLRTADGKVYLVIGGTDARVIEVSGLDTIKRFAGQFTYTASQFSEVQKQLAAAAAKPPATELSYAIVRATAPPSLDHGGSKSWPELFNQSSAAVNIQEMDSPRFARAALRWDDQNLYAAWRVKSSSPPRNSGQDWRLFFKTGDSVDLMIGGSDRQTGNSRALIAFPPAGPVAVFNRKSAPGAKPDEHYDFTSPWRKITFDRVVKVPQVAVAMQPISGGYLVQASIPWTLLGIAPSKGLKLRGDLGVLSADGGGTQTIARRYWSNKATGLVNDIPGEADLEPATWGNFVLE
jgi:hypothetical protein